MSSSSAAMAAAGAPHSSPPDPSPTKPKRRFFFPPCRSHSPIGPPPPPPTPSRLDPNLHRRPAPCRPAPTELPAAVKPLFTLFLESEKPPIPPSDDSIQIREVWASNLDAEFELIRGIVENFPYVAMDTEFPGIVIRPVGNFKTSSDFNYATLKANVDLLKLIQLGLTFSDEDGNLPDCGTGRGGCVWQFNFREFNPENDCFANDSIQLLRQSGINFDRNTDDGVDARRFGELLMSSGVVLNCAVHWVTFHSGYDFGYLLKQVPSLWVSAHVDCDLKLQPSHCFILSCYGPMPIVYNSTTEVMLCFVVLCKGALCYRNIVAMLCGVGETLGCMEAVLPRAPAPFAAGNALVGDPREIPLGITLSL